MAPVLQQNKKRPDDPSTTSEGWDIMFPSWDMIGTLLGGTRAMRVAERTYLPQHDEESDTNYTKRLAVNTLFNMTELTLDAWVGRPFSDPVKLSEETPEEIQVLANDIDLQGNSMFSFCRNWFREGLAKGMAHCLVEFPVMSDEEREGRTLADDAAEGRRPYWVMIKPENVIFMHAENFNGQEVLTHVRILEVDTQMVGFTEVFRQRIRVLEPGRFQIWENTKPLNKKPKWEIVEEGETDLPFIPFVTFYSNPRDAIQIVKPPMEDLAFLNVRHWQSTSDQVNILTVARFPIMAVAGATDATGTQMAIGPRQLLGTRDANGRFYYVEHSGKAIGAGKADLEDLEDQMSDYGAQFLRRRPGNLTATARALDSAEATSPLQDATIRFIDSVNQALAFTAIWMNLENGGEIIISTEFGPEEDSDIDLRTLNEARRNRDISRERYLKELKRRAVLADDFDPAMDIQELQNEPEILSPFATGQSGTNRKLDQQQGRPPGRQASGDGN